MRFFYHTARLPSFPPIPSPLPPPPSSLSCRVVRRQKRSGLMQARKGAVFSVQELPEIPLLCNVALFKHKDDVGLLHRAESAVHEGEREGRRNELEGGKDKAMRQRKFGVDRPLESRHGLDSFQFCSLGPPTFPPSLPPSLPPSHLCATTTVVL